MTRIRWHENGDEITAFYGTVGTLTSVAPFHILRPSPGFEHWALTTRFYGNGTVRRGEGPDELKAEAERWLEEFVSSLGAVFPTAEAVIVRCDELREGDRLLDSDAMVTVRRVDTYDDHLGISVWAEEGRPWYLDRQPSSLVAVCRASQGRTGDGEPQ